MNLIFWLIGIIGILTLAFDRPRSARQEHPPHLWLISSGSVKPRRGGRHPMAPHWYVPAV